MWSSNNKLSRWVDVVDDFIIEKCPYVFILYLIPDTRYQNVYNILTNTFKHCCISLFLSAIFARKNKFIMLSANYNSMNTLWLISIIIFYSNLTFGIRAQVCNFLHTFAKISHNLPFATYISKYTKDAMA